MPNAQSLFTGKPAKTLAALFTTGEEGIGKQAVNMCDYDYSM